MTIQEWLDQWGDSDAVSDFDTCEVDLCQLRAWARAWVGLQGDLAAANAEIGMLRAAMSELRRDLDRARQLEMF